jgi:hypothetical protein
MPSYPIVLIEVQGMAYVRPQLPVEYARDVRLLTWAYQESRTGKANNMLSAHQFDASYCF